MMELALTVAAPLTLMLLPIVVLVADLAKLKSRTRLAAVSVLPPLRVRELVSASVEAELKPT